MLAVQLLPCMQQEPRRGLRPVQSADTALCPSVPSVLGEGRAPPGTGHSPLPLREGPSNILRMHERICQQLIRTRRRRSRDGGQRARLGSSNNQQAAVQQNSVRGMSCPSQTALLYGHDTQLNEQEPNPAAVQSLLLLKRAPRLLPAAPLGTPARGRDCHSTQQGHTACSVTAPDLTQQKKLLFPHMKYQRKKNVESQASHLCCAEPRGKFLLPRYR